MMVDPSSPVPVYSTDLSAAASSSEILPSPSVSAAMSTVFNVLSLMLANTSFPDCFTVSVTVLVAQVNVKETSRGSVPVFFSTVKVTSSPDLPDSAEAFTQADSPDNVQSRSLVTTTEKLPPSASSSFSFSDNAMFTPAAS